MVKGSDVDERVELNPTLCLGPSPQSHDRIQTQTTVVVFRRSRQATFLHTIDHCPLEPSGFVKYD
jgi:hypothetical protein